MQFFSAHVPVEATEKRTKLLHASATATRNAADEFRHYDRY